MILITKISVDAIKGKHFLHVYRSYLSLGMLVCVCVCLFIKVHVTAKSSPVTLQ